MTSRPAEKLTKKEIAKIECTVREIWIETWKSACAYADGDEDKERKANTAIYDAFEKMRVLGFSVA